MRNLVLSISNHVQSLFQKLKLSLLSPFITKVFSRVTRRRGQMRLLLHHLAVPRRELWCNFSWRVTRRLCVCLFELTFSLRCSENLLDYRSKCLVKNRLGYELDITDEHGKPYVAVAGRLRCGGHVRRDCDQNLVCTCIYIYIYCIYKME